MAPLPTRPPAAWHEQQCDTVAAFDASGEEARRYRSGRRWSSGGLRERQRDERDALYREWREPIERRRSIESRWRERSVGSGSGGDGDRVRRADRLAAEADDDDDEFEWSDDDGPHPETADQQRALVVSFESEKKLRDARAREDAQIRRAVELSLQAVQRGGPTSTRCWSSGVGHRPTHERRRAQQELRRRAGDAGAGPSNAPPGGQ
ncbi:hypothetical protein QYE76_024134 [Lolium multiflorum]|uniref:Uncharacterized protein n=1 Tax=Lolium multiflorum TaxID=4521 RepID=A0AAD8VSZ8_LOLMU|nr:hypothetical protein QYE76_024134 [Lolium multiflorum]